MPVPIAKISPPRLSDTYSRKRLFRHLDSAMERPIAWVSAPAGSGKTTLVASWLDARKLPCLWYQVDEGDSDIATFFYYLGLAAKKAAPNHRKPLPLFTPEYLLGISTFARRYFEQLFSRLKTPCAVVFDNYQEVSPDSPFHEVIREGVSVVPPGVNVIFISRGAPAAAMTPLRAGRRLALLGWEDIRLTLDETAGIAALQSKEGVGAESIRRMHEMAQGWAAGVILMAESMPADDDALSLPGKSDLAEVFDYFAEEILAKTTPEAREFLLKSSLLPTMTAKMAQRLTGLERSEQILSHLVRNHYFTQKHAYSEPVYQYHPLFRDFLLSRLHSYEAEKITTLKRQAATILTGAGEFEDAVVMLRDTEQWEELACLILGQAQSLMQQGRMQTLEEWLDGVPAEVAERVPWILYWKGVCRLPFAPPQAKPFFERAFRFFLSQEDEAGALLAWSGVVDSIFHEGDDLTPLGQWIDWFMERTTHGFPSPDVEMAAVSSLTLALMFRRPDHPETGKWMERARTLSGESVAAPLGLRMQVLVNAAWYYAFCGELVKTQIMIEDVAKMAEKTAAPPLVKLMEKAIEAAAFHHCPERSLQAVYDGLALSEKTGAHVCDHMLLGFGVYASLSTQDTKKASDFLLNLENAVKHLGRVPRGNFNYLTGWYHFVTGDVARAKVFAELTLNVAVMTGMPFPEMLSRLLLAEILAETGEGARAKKELEAVAKISGRTGNRLLEYLSLLAEAHIALDEGNEENTMRLISQAFALGRALGCRTFLFWWRPAKLARLCMKALEAGIEEDFVRSLVLELKLVPEKPPTELENWPWPLKIYTLGRFALVKDGEPVSYSSKLQQKPLALLKLLIALGGREVNEGRLSDLLWPEADGVAARTAFYTTLHRLRRLLGNDRAILMSNGKITLNPRLCWVDAWAFERICEKAEPLLKGKPADKNRSNFICLAEKALTLYHGNFLAGDTGEPWAISPRERLRSRFLNIVGKLGRHLEESGKWSEAAECYRKGLETDDLAEEFYRRLMACHQRLGNRAEALALYNRCRLTLAAVLGVAPCAETRALFKKIEQQ